MVVNSSVAKFKADLEEKEKTPEQVDMDEAADRAEADLANIDEQAMLSMAGWIERWFQPAGYKRLCRVLRAKLRASKGDTNTGDTEKGE